MKVVVFSVALWLFCRLDVMIWHDGILWAMSLGVIESVIMWFWFLAMILSELMILFSITKATP